MKFNELANVEIQMSRVRKTEPQVMTSLIKTHPSEYSQSLEDIFFTASQKGKVIRMILLEEVPEHEESIEPTRDILAIKRQGLAMAIKKHCEVKNLKEDEVLRQLYDDYSISSRTQLKEKQLDDLIHYYTYL